MDATPPSRSDDVSSLRQRPAWPARDGKVMLAASMAAVACCSQKSPAAFLHAEATVTGSHTSCATALPPQRRAAATVAAATKVREASSGAGGGDWNAAGAESSKAGRRATLAAVGLLAGATAGASRARARGRRSVSAAGKRTLPALRTNEVVSVVDGIRQKRLGGSDIVVSELALGTQRWASSDFNGPDEAACHAFMDRAILGSGVNLVDTAEQYPIPSDAQHPEGLSEELIGRWIKKEPGRRQKIVVATKITGGANVTAENIREDCEGSLRRLGTDYIDVYQLHWPARYSPQANWGQSLTYQFDMEDEGGYYMEGASFEEICTSMGKLQKEGKIRGWGMCNDNAFGLTSCCEVAKRLGVPPPVAFQGDYSLIDRKSEENGVFEASSPVHENVGFLAYNTLAGGMLTGKYIENPAAVDNSNPLESTRLLAMPRGRMDDYAWGQTLYRYRSGPAKRAIAEYGELAKQFNMSLAEMSLRWCRERRGCTSVLLGTANMQQLEEDLVYFQKTDGLPPQLKLEIDRVHMKNRLPVFSNDSYGKGDFRGAGQIGERVP
eukprot:TRINITY_DN1779_c0_g4_i1.p1 TRINITY_DN1779_c0_g4~~TRINITY_DN1779_c0_g4_i1.p1  ORF type:complete len:552 (+),score=117.17 TRINITY_DN1779_c0_g4_i1:80-1735(+)